MAKKRKVPHHKKKKAVSGHKKRKPAKKKKAMHGHKHRKWGAVRQHNRRVAGHPRKKRRKKSGIGGIGGKSMQPLIYGAIGFGLAKLLSKKTG